MLEHQEIPVEVTHGLCPTKTAWLIRVGMGWYFVKDLLIFHYPPYLVRIGAWNPMDISWGSACKGSFHTDPHQLFGGFWTSRAHSIHETGVFTYMNGWFLWYKYTIIPWILWVILVLFHWSGSELTGRLEPFPYHPCMVYSPTFTIFYH